MKLFCSFKVFLALLLVLVGIPCAAAAEYTLTIADTTAPIGIRGESLQGFADDIEKATNGQVKMEIYWGESLLKEKEFLKGIQDGVVDMGYLNPNYYPKEMMAHEVFAIIPQGPMKYSTIAKMYREIYAEVPELERELSNNNQIGLFRYLLLPSAVFSTKPFTKFEDYEGQRIRASSRWWLAELQAAKSIPISMPLTDCYMALQTGGLEGVMTNIDSLWRNKLHEPASNIYATRQIWIGMPQFYTINADKWNSLPKEIQDQIMKAVEMAEERYDKLYEAEWGRVVEDLEKNNCVVTYASDEEVAKWVQMPAITELQAQWVSEAEEAGMENAAEILRRVKEIVQKYIDMEKQ